MTQEDKRLSANTNVDPLSEVIRRQSMELARLMEACHRLRDELRIHGEKNISAQAKRAAAHASDSQKP